MTPKPKNRTQETPAVTAKAGDVAPVPAPKNATPSDLEETLPLTAVSVSEEVPSTARPTKAKLPANGQPTAIPEEVAVPSPEVSTTPAPAVSEAVVPATPATEVSVTPADSAIPPMPAERVALIIDDEPANRDFLVRLIAQAKYTSKGAASGKEGLDLAQAMTFPPLIIVIDSELPDTSGLDLIQQFRAMFPHITKLVMATMHDNPTIIHRAFEEGCDAFLVKPHGFMELYKRLLLLPDDPNAIHRIVIDKYGIRPFKGTRGSPA